MGMGQYSLRIENQRFVNNAGNLRAFCDVRIPTAGGDWVIRDCRIIQQTGQRAWFSLPVISWKNEMGEVCHKTILELPPSIKRRIASAVLEVYYKSQAQAD